MSIWCSWRTIGTDPTQWQDERGRDVPKRSEHGEVLSYAAGWSNHHPDLTGEAERPAAIAVASVAPWCVPGHDQDGERYACTGCGEHHDVEVGPWLRLEVAAPEVVNFWTKDVDGNPEVRSEGATVVLDRDAAAALRDDLNRFLNATHVLPTAPPAPTEERPAAEGGGGRG